MDKQTRDKQLIEQELHRIIHRNDFKLAESLLYFALGFEQSKYQKEGGASQ